MRDIDVRCDGGDSERTRRIEMGIVLLVPGVVGQVTAMRHGAVIDALNDRTLVRAERQLQAIGLRGQHESDRQERARHQ